MAEVQECQAVQETAHLTAVGGQKEEEGRETQHPLLCCGFLPQGLLLKGSTTF